MSQTIDDKMVQAGYAPAVEVATLMGKALSTVHRMVAEYNIDCQRDGRYLYVSVRALLEHYMVQDNSSVMLSVLKPLVQKYRVKLKD